MAKLNRNGTAVSDYVLCHLAAIGKEAGEIAEDLVEDTIFPDGKPYDAEKHRAILRERLVGKLAYIAAGCRDLLIAGRIVRCGEGKNPGQSDTQPGGIGVLS